MGSASMANGTKDQIREPPRGSRPPTPGLAVQHWLLRGARPKSRVTGPVLFGRALRSARGNPLKTVEEKLQP